MQATYSVRRFQINAFALAFAIVVLLAAATITGLWVRGIGTQTSPASVSIPARAAAASDKELKGQVELRRALRQSDQPVDGSPLASRGAR
jgi:hypothetical protein